MYGDSFMNYMSYITCSHNHQSNTKHIQYIIIENEDIQQILPFQ